MKQLFAALMMSVMLATVGTAGGPKMLSKKEVKALVANASTPTDHNRLAEHYLTRSTLLTSQLPVAKWHAQIGDPTVADSMLDRLVHGAHRIELQGDSIRKLKGRNGKKGE